RVDTPGNDDDLVAGDLVRRLDAVRDIAGGSEDAIACRQRARIGLVAPRAREVFDRIAVDEPQPGALAQRRHQARGADALRVHEIDALGGDEVGDRPRVAPRGDEVAAFGGETYP